MRIRPQPCSNCPWVRSTPPGEFPAERYEALRSTSGRPGAEAPLGAPLFACHKTTEGKELPCAGWLAAVGWESLSVRVLVAQKEIPVEALSPGADWPELYASYAEMERAQAG